jgi:protein HOOK3
MGKDVFRGILHREAAHLIDLHVQVNTFELPHRVTAWSQLEDGQILWSILSDIDPSYFSESLPNFDFDPASSQNRRSSLSLSASSSESWIPRWQNLKHIERAVSTYIREECQQLPVLTKRMIPDLKTGARDGSLMMLGKLTMAVLLAGLYSEKSNERMVRVMSGMEGKGAEHIAQGIQEMQALDQRMAALGMSEELTPEPSVSGYRTPTRAVSGAGSTVERDSGLEQEAQLFEANKDRQALRDKVTRLQEEMEKSKDRINQLEEELVEARLHLDDRGAERTSSDEVEKLRHDLARDRQYIEGLEADLQNARDIVDSQKRRLERLGADEGSKQELRDQLQLVRAERDELNQKAKANENLKKKIHSLTQETKNLETLRQDYQQARERLLELENVEERCTSLEKVNKENAQTIVQCEQSIFEEKGKRTRVEHENLVLMKQLEQTRELQYRAEESKRELEDRIRDLESSSHASRGGSLEDELNPDDSTDNLEPPTSSTTLTDSRISSDAIALQQKVDILNARLKSLEQETLKQMQENLGLRSDMMAEKDEESQKPFLQQNEKLQTVEAELQEVHRRLRETNLKVAELQNELNKSEIRSILLSANANKIPESDINEDVKESALQTENQRLLTLQQKSLQKLRELELSNDEKSGLLRAALLDRENLSPELLELMKAELLAKIKEQIERVITAPADSRPRVLEAEATDIAKTVMESKAALDGVKKVSALYFARRDSCSEMDSSVPFRSTLSSMSLPVMSSSCHLPFTSECKDTVQPARNQSMSKTPIPSATRTESTALGRLSQLLQIFSKQRAYNILSQPVISQPNESAVGSVPGDSMRPHIRSFPHLHFLSFINT